MRNRARVIAAAAVTAALAAGGTGAAVASATDAKPGTHEETGSASKKPSDATPAEERRVHRAITAAVAHQLHVSMARANAALQPLFAAGRADTSSPVFAAAARSLGVSTQQLSAALAHAKESVAGGPYPAQNPGGSKDAGSKAAERRAHDAIAAAVAHQLHVSTVRVNAALRPLFAAGEADPSSPVFAAAARSLGVSTQRLSAALVHGKESLVEGS